MVKLKVISEVRYLLNRVSLAIARWRRQIGTASCPSSRRICQTTTTLQDPREELSHPQCHHKTRPRFIRLPSTENRCRAFQSWLVQVEEAQLIEEIYRWRALSSDIAIQLDGETLHGHRFILAARSPKWDSAHLAEVKTLDLSGKQASGKSPMAFRWRLDIPYDVGFQLMKWVYTDEIVEKQNEDFLLTLINIAKRFELKELIEQ